MVKKNPKKKSKTEMDKVIDFVLGPEQKKGKKTKKKITNRQELEDLAKKTMVYGRNLERNKNYMQAITEYTLVIDKFKEVGLDLDELFFFRRGYAYLEIKEYQKSVDDYLEYLKIRPRDYVAYNNIGLNYCYLGKHKKEFQSYKKTNEIKPNYALAYRNRAVCKRDKKEYKKALEYVDKAIELEPVNHWHHSIKGDVLLKMGKKDDALDSYETAHDLNKNDSYVKNKIKQLKGVKGNKSLSDFNAHTPIRNYSNVAGMSKLKRWGKTNIIAPLHHKELAKKYGKRFGGGILMYGPPGCGKTFFASALAGEANVNFMKIKISGVFDMWIGNTEKNIEKLFRTAKRKRPCIIFIDEIDGLGAKRHGGPSGKYAEQAVNQFLMEISELEEKNSEVLIIGATNAPWKVDDALKRSGRFGKIVYVSEPEEDARKALFKMYLKDIPTDKKINITKLAKLSNHLSAADIRAICEEAAGIAFEKAYESKNLVHVTQKMLEKAVKEERSDVLEWYNTVTKMMSEDEMREFYPDLYEDLQRIRKARGSGVSEEKMFG